MARSFVLVMDSLGIGSAADAEAGDIGADTLGHIAAAARLRLPNLERCGLGLAAQASTGRLPTTARSGTDRQGPVTFVAGPTSFL